MLLVATTDHHLVKPIDLDVVRALLSNGATRGPRLEPGDRDERVVRHAV